MIVYICIYKFIFKFKSKRKGILYYLIFKISESINDCAHYYINRVFVNCFFNGDILNLSKVLYYHIIFILLSLSY